MRGLVTVPVLLMVGALAGCGSSSSSTSATSAQAAGAAATTSSASSSGAASSSISVVESDFKITPSNPSVAAGSVRVTVHNSGQVVHALEIVNGGPGGKNLRSATLQPGSTATIVADLKPGKTYQWYCPIDGHKALGMTGTITTSASGGAAAAPSTSQTTSSSSSSTVPGY